MHARISASSRVTFAPGMWQRAARIIVLKKVAPSRPKYNMRIRFFFESARRTVCATHSQWLPFCRGSCFTCQLKPLPLHHTPLHPLLNSWACLRMTASKLRTSHTLRTSLTFRSYPISSTSPIHERIYVSASAFAANPSTTWNWVP